MKNTLLTFIFMLFLLKWDPASSQTNGTIQHNGISRSYIVYVPSSYVPGNSWPLVFVLHGFTQSASTIMSVSGFNSIADTGNFIIAYPNGVGNAWNTNSGMTGGSTADDIGFIAALTDTLHALYNIDTNRVFSCGFSAGGYMSHRLACESPRCYAAIASVAGTMSVGAYTACAPSHSIPVAQIHGTADGVVSYNGSTNGGKSVDEVIALWVGNNTCAVPPLVQLLPDINVLDNSTVEKSVYSPCNSGTEVALYKVIGGGHQWPGTTAILGGLGTINRDINASAEIWNFFRNYSCPNFVTGIENPVASSLGFILTKEPTVNGYTISLSDKSNKVFRIELFDLSGKCIRNESASGVHYLNSLDLPKGIYVLRATSGEIVNTFKLSY